MTSYNSTETRSIINSRVFERRDIGKITSDIAKERIPKRKRFLVVYNGSIQRLNTRVHSVAKRVDENESKDETS